MLHYKSNNCFFILGVRSRAKDTKNVYGNSGYPVLYDFVHETNVALFIVQVGLLLEGAQEDMQSVQRKQKI